MRLVEIDELFVDFAQHDGVVQAVRGVSLHVDAGESLGIVGESGSGKSVSCLAVLQLLRKPPARISAKKLELSGEDMLSASPAALAKMRGAVAAMSAFARRAVRIEWSSDSVRSAHSRCSGVPLRTKSSRIQGGTKKQEQRA